MHCSKFHLQHYMVFMSENFCFSIFWKSEGYYVHNTAIELNSIFKKKISIHQLKNIQIPQHHHHHHEMNIIEIDLIFWIILAKIKIKMMNIFFFFHFHQNIITFEWDCVIKFKISVIWLLKIIYRASIAHHYYTYTNVHTHHTCFVK